MPGKGGRRQLEDDRHPSGRIGPRYPLPIAGADPCLKQVLVAGGSLLVFLEFVGFFGSVGFLPTSGLRCSRQLRRGGNGARATFFLTPTL